MSAGLRLMWKEYRVLRGFWFALAIFGLACDGLIFLFVDNPQDRLSGLYSLVAVVPACFALGAGATLFALEREESTRDLLQYLPLTSLRVFRSKISVALGGTLLLTLLLLGVGLGIWFAFGNATVAKLAHEGELTIAVQIAAVCTLVVLQGMGWSVFFSLRSGRPLLAAILGALGALPYAGLVQFVALRLGSFEPRWSWLAPCGHVAATSLIWLVDVWLASTWLHGRRGAISVRLGGPTSQTPLTRQLWQQWRSSRRMLAALAVLGLILPLLQGTDPYSGGLGVVPAVGLVLALLGSCTFLGDQERSQFRFFAERGVSGRSVWFGRLLFWVGSASVLAMALLVVAHLCIVPPEVLKRSASTNAALTMRTQSVLSWFAVYLGPSGVPAGNSAIGWLAGLSGYIVWLALAFGAGQLCSMFCRSGLLAAVFGVILAEMLLAWAAVMHMLSIGWWWSVAPLAVALFAATRLRVDAWILERRHVRAWLPSVLALAVPVVAILIAVPIYRVLEIPNVDVEGLQISSQTPASAESNDAVRRVLKMCEQMPLPRARDLQALNNEFPAWLEENERAFDALIEALSRLPADAAGESVPSTSAATWHILSAMLVRYGQLAEDDGKLDEAWTRYHAAIQLARIVRLASNLPGEASSDDMEDFAFLQLIRWGARKGQTVERLRSAIDVIGQFEVRGESLADHIRRLYEQNLARLDEAQAQPHPADAIYGFAAKWAPWEFSRARRLLRYAASLDLQDAEAADRAFADGTMVRVRSPRSDRARADLLLQTTFLQQPVLVQSLIEARRLTLFYRRATELGLAAECWRLDHGGMPEKLDELGQYIQRLRPDPYTSQPFLWFPLGLRASVRSKNLSDIPAKTPLLYGPAKPSLDATESDRLEVLRRRSVDDPIWHANESIQLEAGGAAAPAMSGGMAAGGMPAPAAMSSAAPGPSSPTFPTVVVDSAFTYLEGLAFPIPDAENGRRDSNEFQ